MRTFVLTALVAATVAMAMATDLSEVQLRTRFAAFKQRFGKQYPGAAEEERRFSIFAENMKKAAGFAAKNPLATFGENEFADVSAAEFKVRHSAEKQLARVRAAAGTRAAATLVDADMLAAMPTSIDWRTKGAVTYVKNQGQCGSCWSFSTTGSIEGAWFLAGNPLVALSEQELVSCDTIDDGCNGGFPDDAYEWLFFQHGGSITTESAYPYVSGNGVVPKCNSGSLPVGATITAYADVARNESIMAAQLAATGPLSICVDATSWQTYAGGIMTDCISQEIDHAVLAVGYDLSYSTPYWIVKNSWGSSWGEDGYIRVAFGSNLCLISEMGTRPIVTAGPKPPTPAPPTPPTPPSPTPTPVPPTPPTPPTPTPSGKTYTQKVCTDAACSSGCQTQTIPQDTCIVTPDGYGAIAKCTAEGLKVDLYLFSTTCQGLPLSKVEPLNTCEMDSDGTYIENICPSGVDAAARVGAAVHRVSKAHKEFALRRA